MRYYTTYISGLPVSHKPGFTNAIITRKGLKVFGQTIAWSDIISSEVTYEVKDKSVSAGKAVAGAIIAGPVGAVVGGMLGGKGVDSNLKVTYRTSSGQNELLLAGNSSDTVNKVIAKRLRKSSTPIQGSNPTSTPIKQQSTSNKLVGWYFAPYRYGYRLIKKLAGKP